nr:ribosome recycling factor [Gehongia tenuis]
MVLSKGGISVPDALIQAATKKMEKTVELYKQDLASLRASRANPQVLDRIMVDYYGVPTPINQVGNVAVPEPRLLTITLWDTSMLKEVEKALLASDLGLTPSNDGKMIRLVFPELTEERRKELVKVLYKKNEEAKVAVRAVRRDTIDQFRRQKKNGEMTEDDYKDLEDEIQKLTDAKVKMLEGITAEKEKEIMEI